MKCIRCNTNEGSFSFKVMEVHEEYVSGKSGFLRSSRKPSQKIQSLSDMKEFCVCDACIDKKLQATMNPWRDFLNYYKVGAVLLVFGIIILVNYGGKDTIYTVGGVFLVMIALLRAYGYFRKAKAKKDQYMKMSENNRRFVSAWECVSESAPKRLGKSRWTLKKKIRLVTDTLFSFSSLPITIIETVGVLSFFGAAIWAIAEIIFKIMGIVTIQGWTLLFIFSLFSFGVIMITLGTLGEYIWRTFDASRKRPTYIVEESIDEK